VRRLVAAGLLLAFFGFALWLGVSALGSGGDDGEEAAPPLEDALGGGETPLG